ncbi:hypothetical protein TSMEX_004104 [Taenia solium]|eukprot:TsM_000385000 transcript=TsM_000385000 gene=TsM_000385000
MSKLKWIDKHVCATLLSHPRTPPLLRIDECISQHFEQMKFDLQFPSIPVPARSLKRIDCIVIRSIVDFAKLFPLKVTHLMLMDLSMQIVDSAPTTAVAVGIFRSSNYNLELRHIFGFDYSQLLGNENAGLRRGETGSLAYYDCVLYIVELSLLLRQSLSVNTELRAIVANLSSNQTFGIIIIEDVKCKEESGLAFFIDCLKRLSFVCDSPLMSTTINWRVWCIQEDASLIADRRDIFEWACRDVIWRRMQKRFNQFTKMIYKALDFPS